MKKAILTFVLVCLILTGTACGKKNKKSNNPVAPTSTTTVTKAPAANTNNGVISEHIIDGLKISNVSLIVEGDSSTYNADITNTTENPIDVLSFNIFLKDAEGNVVKKLLGYIGMTIQPGASQTLTIYVGQDLSSITQIEYSRNY